MAFLYETIENALFSLARGLLGLPGQLLPVIYGAGGTFHTSLPHPLAMADGAI